jgi:hypothetical protein
VNCLLKHIRASNIFSGTTFSNFAGAAMRVDYYAFLAWKLPPPRLAVNAALNKLAAPFFVRRG